ncbi:hypothetical protein [Candidatus Uabimicrobium amorphum]|uniref:Uncharacterized protein n=1 Tax=Uabimicrobium amorphum TaxID=2596890 RepID=A0A5S9IML1_UABAM|nr:hypothetical protein [Candidatus Uabimicrobium amorphum]BBM84112.1 hypothetical protein UABAM_02468 [Candidatus Uabimicrobium amorphum]
MSILRYLLGLFRCHGTANQKAFSVAIGVLIGLTYSAGVTWLLFLPLLLIFRFSVPFVLFTALASWGASVMWLEAFLYEIGLYALAGNSSWSFFWQDLTHTPVLTFFELDRYTAFGAWCLAITASFFLYIFTYFLSIKLADTSLANSLHYNKWSIKMRSRLWQDRDVTGNKIVRPHLTVILLACVVLLLAFVSLCSGIVTRWYIEKYVNPHLGTQVEITNASIDVWSQKILISQVEIKNPKDRTILMTADFLEVDFSLTSLFDRQLYLSKVSLSGATLHLQKKNGMLNLSQLHVFPNVEVGEKSDWVMILHQLLTTLQQKQLVKEQQRIKIVEDYIFLHSPKKPRTIQTLLKEKNLESLSQLNELKEPELISQAASARYIRPKSPYAIATIESQKLVIDFHDQDKDKQQKLELQFAIRNLQVPAVPLSPVEIDLKVTDLPVADYKFLHEDSCDVWFTAGKVSLSFSGNYDQGLFAGKGEIQCREAKMQSTDEAQVFSMNARDFLWGLNKTEGFATTFTIVGHLPELNLQVPTEPLMTVSKTTNSNLEEN